MQKADIIIIGGGPGGYETAAGAAASGKSVILFEKNKLGGTCLNRGCIPTKCLCSAVETIEAIKNAPEFGIECDLIKADYSVAHRRALSVIAELRQGIETLLSSVTVVREEASLMPGGKVEAAGTVYEAEKIIIATGSRPAVLKVDGAEYTINSDEFLDISNLPERLTIIGGGVIGLEFAGIANAFGAKVTVLEYCKEILPGCDSDIAKRLKSFLSRRGIDIVTDAAVVSVGVERNVSYVRKGKSAVVEGDMVLAAVGRRPVLPPCKDGFSLPLNEKGFIAVDDVFHVSDNIYAIGDVNGKCMLAHAASAQGRVVLGADVNLDVIPSVVFTQPECAFVSDKSVEVTETIKLPYSSNGKAVAGGHSDGLIKVGYDKESGRLISCAVIGSHAADIIAEASLAISAKMTVKDVARSVHAHPTLSELFYSAVERAGGGA